MLKKLTIGLLFVSGIGFSSEGDQRQGPNDNPLYRQLLWDYEDICKSDMPQKRKAEELQGITEKMRGLAHVENKDYNSCMRESNKQQRSDYDRCDRNGSKDKCYDRADKNNDNRRAACERVAHSDNAKETAKATN